MSELQAPLFLRRAKAYPSWVGAHRAVASFGFDGRELPVDPVYVKFQPPPVVISLSDSIMENVERLRHQALRGCRSAEDVWSAAESFLALAPLPSDRLWLEFREPRAGWAQSAVYVVRHKFDQPGQDSHRVFLIEQDGAFQHNFPACGARMLRREIEEHWEEDECQAAAGLQLTLAIICAVLAAPGVRSTNEQRSLKRLQQRKGQPSPVVTYRCVDIDIDRLASIPESGAGSPGGGGRDGGVALHHVRGHLRLTEKSGLVPVRAHWRGDPRYGTKLRDYNYLRNEDGEAH